TSPAHTAIVVHNHRRLTMYMFALGVLMIGVR
ncbi:uncharacterized protein METZ01_LOCUS247682, partial [marine metagenome]